MCKDTIYSAALWFCPLSFSCLLCLVTLCKVSLLKAFHGPRGTQRLKDMIQMKSSLEGIQGSQSPYVHCACVVYAKPEIFLCECIICRVCVD